MAVPGRLFRPVEVYETLEYSDDTECKTTEFVKYEDDGEIEVLEGTVDETTLPGWLKKVSTLITPELEVTVLTRTVWQVESMPVPDASRHIAQSIRILYVRNFSLSVLLKWTHALL